MAEAGTLCIAANVLYKAGANASAVSITEAYTNVFILQAEAFVSVNTKYDLVANYASISTLGKELLRDVTSSIAAINVINYDMSGYTKAIEAQVMLDILCSSVTETINLLRDKDYKEFVLNGDTD